MDLVRKTKANTKLYCTDLAQKLCIKHIGMSHLLLACVISVKYKMLFNFIIIDFISNAYYISDTNYNYTI